MGTDWKNQLLLILNFLGTPKENDKSFIENPKAKTFLDSYPEVSEQEAQFDDYFENVEISEEGKDLLKKMLIFNPEKRIGVDGAL